LVLATQKLNSIAGRGTSLPRVLVASVAHSLTSLIGNHGLYAVFGLMAIDAVFPAASELVMVYAGALAAGAFTGQHVDLFGLQISSHLWGFVAMSLAGALGYLVGAIVGWAIGIYGGRPLLEGRGRWFHLSDEKLDRAERWFDRWDVYAVFIGRITPVIRSFISIPAGIFRMPFGPYIVLTAIGSAIWAFAFAGIGWAAGRSYERFHHDFGYVEYVVVAAILVLLAFWIVRRWRASRLSSRASDPAG
jgi:membrane protein DedA with SNARE-associated domain